MHLTPDPHDGGVRPTPDGHTRLASDLARPALEAHVRPDPDGNAKPAPDGHAGPAVDGQAWLALDGDATHARDGTTGLAVNAHAWLAVGLLALVAEGGVDALALGAVSVVVLLVAAAIMLVVQRRAPIEAQLPMLVLVAATAATACDMALQAALPALHGGIRGTFPLVAFAAVLLARSVFSNRSTGIVAPTSAEPPPATRPPSAILGRSVSTATFILALLLPLSTLREALGTGTLFAGAAPRLHAPWLETTFASQGFLPLLLPPGALLLLAAAASFAQRRAARLP